MDKSICILIAQAPYGTIHAAEAVRHVGGALSQGFRTVALLVDDGVWLAQLGQNAEASGYVALGDALAATLPGAQVAVHLPSMANRGLTPADLIPGVQFVDDEGLAQLMTDTQYMLRF